jgi:hypothetical protein
MQLALCRHIKTNGTRCKAPSLSDGTWCYFHHRLHQRHTAFRPTAASRGYLIPGQHIELSTLEDRESVQVALSVVINALATGQLDIKRATALLYGLQLASNNAARLQTTPYAPDVVRSVEPSPEGLDLAQPAATLDTDNLYNFNDDEDEQDEEEEFTEEQTNSFLEMYRTEPSRNRQQQDRTVASPNRLVVAERDHRPDAGGSSSGDVPGEQRDRS